MTDTTDTGKIAEQLNARLAELTGNIARLEAEQAQPLDADFSEQANELEDQDALAGVEENNRVEVNQIYAALNRIEAGTYGTCSNCGTKIPAKRLEVQPTATLCIKCAELVD